MAIESGTQPVDPNKLSVKLKILSQLGEFEKEGHHAHTLIESVAENPIIAKPIEDLDGESHDPGPTWDSLRMQECGETCFERERNWIMQRRNRETRIKLKRGKI